MLDTRKIGAYISSLRKEKDMTQVELADRLNVSHQAVSKWERGESLPDIGTLPQLAQVFGKTVDDILNGGEVSEQRTEMGAAIQELSANRPDRVAGMVNAGELNMEKLVDIAPMVKASSLNQITEQLDMSRITPSILQKLAPFISTETLDRLVVETENGNLDWNMIQNLAPFMSRETMNRLVKRIIDGNIPRNVLSRLAPFLDKETVADLVMQIENDQLSAELLTELAPFIDKETVSRLVIKLMGGQ